MAVLIETTLGDLVVDLFVKERPRCSMNFVKLCKLKYYNLCQFHTIEQNYIAQTGDPTGSGAGGESMFALMYGDQAKYFEPESVPKMRHTRMGLVSMVNNGSGMLGSQFFITLGDNLDYLDDKHTIFGQVTEGLETLEKLNDQICDEHNKPYKDIRISHTIVLDDPYDDPPQLLNKYPSRSPSPTLDLITASKIALDERLNEDEGKTEEEIRKEMEAKDMAAQAQILEMVGDLRYADEKPPENVLFICKLNPVTTDEDLEIIFSRFGTIKCCEVIRDHRTGISLQYAFIEFEEEKSCENAYFKMDNVLIDDRRIHVDFSQSVAKNYKWHRKEKGKAKETTSQVEKQNRKNYDDNDGGKERKRSIKNEANDRADDEMRKRSRTVDDKRALEGYLPRKSRDNVTDNNDQSTSKQRVRSSHHHTSFKRSPERRKRERSSDERRTTKDRDKSKSSNSNSHHRESHHHRRDRRHNS